MLTFEMIILSQDVYWNSKQNIRPTNEIVTILLLYVHCESQSRHRPTSTDV